MKIDLDGLYGELEMKKKKGMLLSQDVYATGHLDCSKKRSNPAHRTLQQSLSGYIYMGSYIKLRDWFMQRNTGYLL